MKFWKCPVCGNIITMVEGDINRVNCCGKPLEELKPNVEDAASIKHLPVYEKKEDEIIVKVGEVEHPMAEDHYIKFVCQVTETDFHLVNLKPQDKIKVRFKNIKGSKIYGYCNLHGLWVTEVE